MFDFLAKAYKNKCWHYLYAAVSTVLLHLTFCTMIVVNSIKEMGVTTGLFAGIALVVCGAACFLLGPIAASIGVVCIRYGSVGAFFIWIYGVFCSLFESNWAAEINPFVGYIVSTSVSLFGLLNILSAEKGAKEMYENELPKIFGDWFFDGI